MHYKQIEAKYVKAQEQVADIFTKLVEYDVFTKIRDLLRVMKKSSLGRGFENWTRFLVFIKNRGTDPLVGN